MDKFDKFIKNELGQNFYGRYVDDFIIIDENKDKLSSLIPVITEFLSRELSLTLHPKKIYLQHYSKGVKFLGAVVKPNRIYISNRTKGNFYSAVKKQNNIIKTKKITEKDKELFLCSMNSYLGLLKHYKTYKIRKKIIFKILYSDWLNHFKTSNNFHKIKKKYKVIKSQNHHTNWSLDYKPIHHYRPSQINSQSTYHRS